MKRVVIPPFDASVVSHSKPETNKNEESPKVDHARTEPLPPEDTRKRKQTNGFGAAASAAAMEQVVSTLGDAGLATINTLKLSTTVAHRFNNMVDHGWSEFEKATGERDDSPSFARQLLVTTALVLAGLPQSKPIETFDSVCISNREFVYCILCGFIEQVIATDTNCWFCDPVPRSEPGYYEAISSPMDLGTCKDKCIKNFKHLSSVELFDMISQDIKQIWVNAVTFNPKRHPVYDMASKNSVIVTNSLRVLAGLLNIPWKTDAEFRLKKRVSEAVISDTSIDDEPEQLFKDSEIEYSDTPDLRTTVRKKSKSNNDDLEMKISELENKLQIANKRLEGMISMLGMFFERAHKEVRSLEKK